jgi:hypothetical protein
MIKQNLRKEEEAFIKALVYGKKSKQEAYLEAFELKASDFKHKNSLKSTSFNLFNKLKQEIIKVQEEFDLEKKIEGVDKKLEFVKKKEILEEKKDLLQDWKKTNENFLIVAKNPLLFSQVVSLAALQALTGDIILTDDKKNIKHVEFDYEKWEYLTHLKHIFTAGILNKEMFDAKIKQNASPIVANQINVNLNK